MTVELQRIELLCISNEKCAEFCFCRIRKTVHRNKESVAVGSQILMVGTKAEQHRVLECRDERLRW
jgi:hypothetical protein